MRKVFLLLLLPVICASKALPEQDDSLNSSFDGDLAHTRQPRLVFGLLNFGWSVLPLKQIFKGIVAMARTGSKAALKMTWAGLKLGAKGTAGVAKVAAKGAVNGAKSAIG